MPTSEMKWLNDVDMRKVGLAGAVIGTLLVVPAFISQAMFGYS